MNSTGPVLVGLGLALCWVTFEIQNERRQSNESKQTHEVATPPPLESTTMKDQSMPSELNQFMSRKNIQTGVVVPRAPATMADVVISDPMVIDQMDRGVTITTGIAPWVVGSSAAVVVTDFDSSTMMQGRDDPSVSWIGGDPSVSWIGFPRSPVPTNANRTVFKLPLQILQPDTVIVSLNFRATGTTSIDIWTEGEWDVNIYKRDDATGATSRSMPLSCAASLSLGAGRHTLCVTVTVTNGSTRPAIFWGSGTIGGGIAGNIRCR